MFGKCLNRTSKPGLILYIKHTVFEIISECFDWELGGVPMIRTRHPLPQLSHRILVYSASQSA